jgi:hypothetical protein
MIRPRLESPLDDVLSRSLDWKGMKGTEDMKNFDFKSGRLTGRSGSLDARGAIRVSPRSSAASLQLPL